MEIPYDISATPLTLVELNQSRPFFRRNYKPLRIQPIPDNSTWIGRECHACKGWQPRQQQVLDEPQTSVNLSILPLGAALLLILGLCAKIVNWFHTDVRMSKHLEYLTPAFVSTGMTHQDGGTCNERPSSSFRKHSRVTPGEENLLLASSSNSSSYTSVFAPVEPPSSVYISDSSRAFIKREHSSASVRSKMSPATRTRTKRSSERKKRNNLDGNTVPVVMYLDRHKLQRQVLRQMERQDSRTRLLATMSHSDLTRKPSNASSGYTSSAPDSRTDSQQDISNTTSISELCSDKVESPICVMSPQNGDNLIIGNLISKSSFLLNIPSAMSPKARYSASPNEYIEDCFIFPGSSQGSSLDQFGPVSPVNSDAPVSVDASSGCQSLTASQCQQLSPDENTSPGQSPDVFSSSVETVKRASRALRALNKQDTDGDCSGRRLRRHYRSRPSVSFEDETSHQLPDTEANKEYYKLARLSNASSELAKQSPTNPVTTTSFVSQERDCNAACNFDVNVSRNRDKPLNLEAISPEKTKKCIWVIGENFDSDSAGNEENSKSEFCV